MAKIILKIFAYLPLSINHFIGYLIGNYLYIFKTEAKKITRININLCFPELSNIEKKLLLKKNLIELGKTITEVGIVWFAPLSYSLNKIKYVINKDILESKKPIIFLAPHMGCWEIVGNYLAQKLNMTILYLPLKNKKMDNLLVKARESKGYKLAKADRVGVIKLQRALANGNSIGILPDQNPGSGNGIFVPFFKRDAQTMTLLCKLARKNNAKVVSVWAERLAYAKGYQIHLKELNILSTTNNVYDDCLIMNNIIEDIIKQKPEQYQLSYARFKRDKNNNRTGFYN